MTRLLHSDVLKILLYVAATLLLGALLAPMIYNAGMALADVTQGKQTNGLLSWLGEKARNSSDNFPRFFNRALMAAAVLMLFPLLFWLRMGRATVGFRDTPWSLRLPDSAVVSGLGQPLRRNPDGWRDALVGFLVALVVLMLSGWLLVRAGFFMWRDAPTFPSGVANPYAQPIEWGRAAREALPRSVVVSVIEEILFRGVLLGIFLRAMRPVPAIASLSLLFAFVHFLQPPEGAAVSDPEAAGAGFELLGLILQRFADPLDFVSRFLVLTAVAVVLAVARYRTASLWLPMGLHAGWVFAYGVFKEASWAMPDVPESLRWLVGTSLLEGVLPLVLVLVTGGISLMFTGRRDDEGLG